MTLLEDAVREDEAAREDAEETSAPVVSPSPSGPLLPPSPLPVCGAAFLAATAAMWLVAGMFIGVLPRVAGVASCAAGAALVLLSQRVARAFVVQLLTIPTGVLLGAGLALVAGGGSVPQLVAEAVRGGGLSDPPLPFDPGWRFLLVVVGVALASGAASFGLSRPRLSLVIPIPVVFGAAALQPEGAMVVSAVGALVLLVAAAAVVFGGDLAEEGASSASFELRRLGRGALVLVAVAASLVGLSQLGFLFPEQEQDQTVPPRRPETPPPAPDRELFTVESPVKMPVRLGVLDVYGIEEGAWLTPPFQNSRLREVEDGAAIGLSKGAGSTVPEPPQGEEIAVTFRIADIAGRSLPTVANAMRIDDPELSIQFDPRTQALRSAGGKVRRGVSYRVTAIAPPSGERLAAAPAPPAQLREFMEAPPVPSAVEDLLAEAPTENNWDRLQFVRNAFYSKVVAAGAGDPVDVGPARVVELLESEPGTPYEITAAEVLLARWAGVPARIGYGFYGGDEVDGRANRLSVRPSHGAMWLEAYFHGNGWVPILGTPPRAQSSLNPDEKKTDPSVVATDKVGMVVYVPVKLQTVALLFETVRYWLVRVVPWVVLALAALVFYPALVKRLRRLRRRRWAARSGLPERIAVAYAEFRDLANDFNFGDTSHTPVRFVLDLAPDDEHEELAWLVTRALWGDLRRDLREVDAVAAEELAGSVARRLRRAHTGLPRLIAAASRASLRNPYTEDIPNLWFNPKPRSGRRISRLRLPIPRPAVAAVLAAFLLAGCVQTVELRSSTSAPEPPAVPDEVDGIRFVREAEAEERFDEAGSTSLLANGRVYSLHEGSTIQGSLQIGVFKPSLAERTDDVKDGVRAAIGEGRLRPTRLGLERVEVVTMPDQRMIVWFDPDGTNYQLLIVRSQFDRADELFGRLLDIQAGRAEADVTRLQPPHDWRRGVPE